MAVTNEQGELTYHQIRVRFTLVSKSGKDIGDATVDRMEDLRMDEDVDKAIDRMKSFIESSVWDKDVSLRVDIVEE